MLRIVAGIVLLIVVRFWVSGLDPVVGQSEAYRQIAGILVGIIFAGRLIATGVGLKPRNASARPGGTAVLPRVKEARTRTA